MKIETFDHAHKLVQHIATLKSILSVLETALQLLTPEHKAAIQKSTQDAIDAKQAELDAL